MAGIRAMAALSACTLLCAGHASAWPTVRLPEQSKGEVVSEHLKYNGLDMKSSRFVSSKGLEDIVAFYAGQWPGQHVVDEVGSKTIIGHAEGRHYVTVELEAVGGGTRGTVGIMKMPDPGQTPTLGEGFYRPAGTDVVSDIVYLDTPNQTRTLVLENELSPYVNQQHYLRRMRAEGWKAVESAGCRPSSTQCVARFERSGGAKMALAISRDEKMLTSTVVTIE
ncbi:hypothetical protein [Marilutibacter aestuarii]|uniref:Uncharacterized protein n=1 Tax=Marilutibacter aestuarii TaxID=1706195 RepID=A0A508A9W7_9GAMM|nr:hypothetical protein [Lysobacter aestuarii]TQD45693.1 hypothetical protein FKV25_07650 [Lysobacter aestuarii]